MGIIFEMKESANSLNLNLFTGVFILVCSGIACVYQDELAAKFKANSSPIDWCENNYEVTPYLAEFWNSISAIAMGVPGVIGYFVYKGTKVERHEPNIHLLWISSWVVAIGSIYFHGNLSVAGQIMDELPLLMLVFFGLFILIPLHKWPSLAVRKVLISWQSLACGNAGGFLLTMLNPSASHILVLSCIPLVAIVGSKEFYYCKEKPWNIFWPTIGCYFIAQTAWLFDTLGCESTKAFFVGTIGFYPQLHAVWHIFVSTMLWFLIVLFLRIRLSGDKKETIVCLK